jgi:hypothetical protein
MSMVGFPLLLIPLAIYNIIVFLMPGVSLAEPLVTLPLTSGAQWPVTLSDVLVALATRREVPHRSSAVAHCPWRSGRRISAVAAVRDLGFFPADAAGVDGFPHRRVVTGEARRGGYGGFGTVRAARADGAQARACRLPRGHLASGEREPNSCSFGSCLIKRYPFRKSSAFRAKTSRPPGDGDRYTCCVGSAVGRIACRKRLAAGGRYDAALVF